VEVCIALDPEEVATIDAAMYALEPWERWGLRLPRVEEERAPALLIDVRVESQAQAKDDAVRIYNRARERAGLPTADALVLGALTPIFADAPHSHLLTEAEGHIETGRREWAVLRAQTACEVYAKKALKRVAMRLPDDARKFRTMTLRDRRDRVLLRVATGVAVGEQSWWPQYELHLQRRDKSCTRASQSRRTRPPHRSVLLGRSSRSSRSGGPGLLKAFTLPRYSVLRDAAARRQPLPDPPQDS
jgi:hypothetical protein